VEAVARVELFSDAVIAIAITLLVLELPFDKVGHGGLAHALGEHWPRFAAYALSFFGIGMMWLHHHALFRLLARVDRPLMLLNLLLLFGAAFLPYPTTLVGDYVEGGGEDARIAVALYSATWVLVTASAALMCRRAVSHEELRSKDVKPEGARRLLRNFQVGGVLYVAFTALAFLSPVAALAGYGVASVFFLARSDFHALGERYAAE
jgi:uncharacterized membrane protein